MSSADQNDARQLEGMVLDKIFTDKASGKDANRPKFLAMLEFVHEDDHIYVRSGVGFRSHCATCKTSLSG